MITFTTGNYVIILMKKLTLFVLCCVFYHAASAQDITSLKGENPTSSKSEKTTNSLGGDLGTLSSGDLFTGATTVTVPFYSYSKNNLDFNLALAFNTKGVRVDEHSGNYGLHWQLNGGGYIIKYINDIEDNATVAYMGSWGEPMNYNSFIGKLNLQPHVNYTYSDAYVDKEYDEYHVSTGMYNFKFYIYDNGSFFVSPHHDVKIEQDGDDFLITDIYGNQYSFVKSIDLPGERHMARVLTGSSASTASYYNDMYIQSPRRVWTLNRIEFPNKEAVSYKYKTYTNEYLQYRYGIKEDGIGSVSSALSKKKNGVELPILEEMVFSNHDSLVLKYHEFSRCDLGTTPLLDKIEVYNRNNLQNYFQLHYSYLVSDAGYTRLYFQNGANCDIVSNSFIDGGVTTEAKALRKQLYYRVQLDSINRHSGITTDYLPYYQFQYYDADRLPPRFSAQQDHWGYYNGKNTDYPNNLTPDYYDASGLDRAVDLVKAKSGNIRKVTDGLGKITEYRYDTQPAGKEYHITTNAVLTAAYSNTDPDFATKLTDSNVIAQEVYDGLRLDSLLVYDPTMPDDNVLIKLFGYSGAMQFNPGARWETRNHEFYDMMYSNFKYSANQTISGSHVGYSVVTESVVNAADELMSMKITRFSNVVSLLNDNTYENNYIQNGDAHYFEAPYTNKAYLKDYKIGLKLKEELFDHNVTLMKEMEYDYTYLVNTFAPANFPLNECVQYRDYIIYNATTDAFEENGKYIPFAVDTYQIFSGKAMVSRIVETNYTALSNSTKDTVIFEYDGSGNLLSKTTKLENDLYYYKKLLYYPKDFLTTGAASRAQNLIDRNILNDVGYKVTKIKKMPSPPDHELLMDASFNTYTFDANNDVYVNSGSKLLKGARAWETNPSPFLDNEKADGAVIMTSDADWNDYISTSKVTKVDGHLRALELKARGVGSYATMRYDTFYKAEVASCNTRFNDFAYIPFDDMVEQDDAVITYDKSKIKTLDPNTTSALTIAPQSGRHCLRLEGGEQVTIDHLNGQKAYVVSCWVTNARSTPPQNIMVKDKNDNIIGTLQLSANHKYGSWHYYQTTVLSNNTDEQLTVYWDEPGSVYPAVWIDNIVVAPQGAAYNIKSFNSKRQVDMEGGLNGKQVRYRYDAFGRPVTISDENGNVKESYHYNINR